MKKFGLLLCMLIASICLCGCSANEPKLKEIRSRGVLRIGIKVDVPGFGYMNPITKEPEGLEIDLAKMIAQDLLGDSNAVKMVGITAQTREVMLNNEELDIAIATFTITPEREAKFAFTQPYYSDELGFLVRKDSGITTITDLDKKTVGTVRFTTASEDVVSVCAARGLGIECRNFVSFPELHAALLNGEVDAFSVDKSILIGYLDDQTMILEEGYNLQEYGIATKLSNDDLAKYLEEFMRKIKEDGRLDEVLVRWQSEIEQ